MIGNEGGIEERVAGKANDWRRSQHGGMFCGVTFSIRFSSPNRDFGNPYDRGVTDFRRGEVRVSSAAKLKMIVILMLGAAEAKCPVLSLNYVTYLTKLQSMSYDRSKNISVIDSCQKWSSNGRNFCIQFQRVNDRRQSCWGPLKVDPEIPHTCCWPLSLGLNQFSSPPFRRLTSLISSTSFNHI